MIVKLAYIKYIIFLLNSLWNYSYVYIYTNHAIDWIEKLLIKIFKMMTRHVEILIIGCVEYFGILFTTFPTS